MNNVVIVILLGALAVFYVELVRYDIKLHSPRYMKPESFFRMYDTEDVLLQLNTEEDIQVKHQYITNMWMNTQDMVSNSDTDHNIQEVTNG